MLPRGWEEDVSAEGRLCGLAASVTPVATVAVAVCPGYSASDALWSAGCVSEHSRAQGSCLKLCFRREEVRVVTQGSQAV